VKMAPAELGLTSVSLGPVTVRSFTSRDRESWEAFVDVCPEATFFHRIGWKDVIESVFGHKTHYMIAESAGRILGILPLAEVRSMLFGNALVSLPFCAYGGAAVTAVEALSVLHRSARDLAAQLRVDHLELRNRTLREADWPRQGLYVTFRKEILRDVDANMLAIPRKQRAMVRKGIKAGLKSDVDDSVDRFFALYAANVHRHGTPPLPKRYFGALRRAFPGATEVLTVVDSRGKPVSSVLSFYFRDEVLPYYAGDDIIARDVAGNDFKYWELMRRACERGCRLFDYGRSKRETGPYDFKKNWGFEPEPLYYEYCLFRGDAVPQVNPLNPKYRAFIALWKRLPIRVANAIGPHVVRSLG